jgi:hypothetical protein
MGAIVFVVLRVMRIDQVRARRTAWLLALVGALAMPALVGAQIGPRLLPDIAPARLQAARISSEPYMPAPSEASNHRVAAQPQAPLFAEERDQERDQQAGFTGTIWSLAVIGYCAVAAVLSLRLCTGVGLALRLRNQAERVIFPFDPGLDVRISLTIATPVTIGSSVLLPDGYTSWDGATLRIVLSHERAHVRQCARCFDGGPGARGENRHARIQTRHGGTEGRDQGHAPGRTHGADRPQRPGGSAGDSRGQREGADGALGVFRLAHD